MFVNLNRNFCGFLNTGLGGIVYMGVLDSGTVYGLRLTTFQKHHILLQVQDMFSRFDPPVDEAMYAVRFVPVRSPGDDPSSVESENDSQQQLEMSDERVDHPHLLRTAIYWCTI